MMPNPRPTCRPAPQAKRQMGTELFSVVFGLIGIGTLALWFVTGQTGLIVATVGSFVFALVAWMWRDKPHKPPRYRAHRSHPRARWLRRRLVNLTAVVVVMVGVNILEGDHHPSIGISLAAVVLFYAMLEFAIGHRRM